MHRPLFLLLTVSISTAAAQGPLDPPPGGPQPTQKSLQEIWNKMDGLEMQIDGLANRVDGVDARVDVLNAPAGLVATNDPDFYYVIQAPGSYYLSRNTSAGGLAIPGPAKPSIIKITANDVTLDLNGFELRAASTTLPGSISADTAILVEGDHVTVRNGSIRGFATSLSASGRSGGVFEDLRVADFAGIALVSGNHATVADCMLVSTANVASGIEAGEGSLVRDCSVRLTMGGFTIFGAGIRGSRGSIVRGCQVTLSGPGINGRCFQMSRGGTIENCAARLWSSSPHIATGFVVEDGGSLVRSCTFTSEGEGAFYGFEIFSGAVAEGCVAHLSSDAQTAIGFTTRFTDAVFRNCLVRGDFGPDSAGFQVTGGASRLSDCRVTDCTVGFESGNSEFRHCTAEGCATGFDLSGAATLGACVARNGSSTQSGVGFNIAAGADGVILRDCVAANMTTGTGFGFNVAGNRARLTGCHADRNNSNFVVTGNNNRLDGCVAIATAVAGGVGFLSSGTNNTVTRCEAKNCSTNFSLNASTKGAAFAFDPATATNPLSNITN